MLPWKKNALYHADLWKFQKSSIGLQNGRGSIDSLKIAVMNATANGGRGDGTLACNGDGFCSLSNPESGETGFLDIVNA